MMGHRPPGKPKKADAPNVPWNEVDRLLVHGEMTSAGDGVRNERKYPSYSQLAERYGVSKSRVAQYSSKRNCMERRRQAEQKELIRYDQKMVESRAEARALSTERQIEIIDEYLAKFDQAMKTGDVRYDSASDFNTMCRLKEFLRGNADSRQELQGSLSLEEMQQRHRALQTQLNSLDGIDQAEGADEPSATDEAVH